MEHSPSEEDLGPVDDLNAQLAAIAAAMTSDARPIAPEGVVDAARVAVPHAQHVGVTLLRPDRAPRSAAATDGIPEELDHLQFELRDGPGLDAATGPPVVLTGNLATDERWPLYGPRCVETTGITSMLCLRLPLGGDDHAGLSFYSDRLDAFSDDDVAAGSLLVPFAALVLEARLRHEDVGNLGSALEGSRIIGTAVGIVMATRRLSREAAFDLLRRASMDVNRKLRDVAEEVTFTGHLPSRPPRH